MAALFTNLSKPESLHVWKEECKEIYEISIFRPLALDLAHATSVKQISILYWGVQRYLKMRIFGISSDSKPMQCAFAHLWQLSLMVHLKTGVSTM